MKIKLTTKAKKLPMMAALFLASSGAVYAQDVLTGDTRLACEAILCLSSGTQPGECRPSLDRYFSIWDKKPWKMIEKRVNFLNLCPASNEPQMPALINAIGNGAGRCDAEFLNKHNIFTYEYQYSTGWGDNQTWHTVTATAVSDALPKYCGIYHNHEFTYEIGVKYVGEPKLGGKWVNERDYEVEKAKYDQRIQEMSKTKSGRNRIREATEPEVYRPRQMFQSDR